MDLFNVQVNEDKLHPNFISVSKDADLVKVLNSWVIGFQDRDNKFVKEFQTTFNTSFWELYLHACFSNLGFRIDYSYSSPDFVIKTRKQKLEIIIEAVSTSHAKGWIPEHEKLMAIEKIIEKGIPTDEDYEEIVHLATERIANAISNKADFYKEKYSKLSHVKGKPFILAIGSFEQPFFYLQGTAAINRVLYGIVKGEYRGDTPYFEYADNILKKKNGSEIPIGLFNSPKYSHISGILFSSVASIGKVRSLSLNKKKNIIIDSYTYNDYDKQGQIQSTPHQKYKESLLDGLSLYLNPYADNPLDPSEFDSNDIAVNYYKGSSKVKHGFLYSRIVFNLYEDELDGYPNVSI